jgi:O-antigen/teichoic acid export membrane protein
MKVGVIKIRDFLVSKITSGSPRSVQAKKHIIYSFVLKGISILIGLMYVPLLLDYLDSERYGIWLTLSSIIGWFEFFDIGLGNGLRNKFTEAIATGRHELARTYVSTTYAILIVVFAIVLFLFYVVNPFLNWGHILNTTIVPARELSILALIVFTFFVLRFIFKIIGIILMADQRPAVNNAFAPVGNIITLIIVLILIKTTKEGSLIVLGLLLSFVPVLILTIMTFVLFSGRYNKYKPSLKYVNLKYSHDLMTLSRRFFLLQIASVVFFTTSNIIITQILGPQEVTVYNIAYKYFTIPVMVYSIIMTPMWSAVTDAYVKEDINWLKNILKKLNIFSVVFVAGILIMLVLSGFAYKIWIGNRVTIPFLMSAMMAVYAIISVILTPYSQYINGFGKLKLTTTIGIFQVLVFIPLAIVLAKTALGAAGVMLAICLINGLGIFIEPVQIYKILNNKANGIWGK